MLKNIAKLWLGSSVVCAVCFGAAPASAQEFYEAGKVSVALERAFGIHYRSDSVDPEGPGDEFDESATTIGLGWYGAITPLHWTRAAVDGFIVDQLSLGGSIGFYTQSGDREDDGVLFAPRVGYAIPLSDVFTFWPRGGLTYYNVSDDYSLLALAGEAMFVASPQENWGILFGVTLDLGFTGSAGDEADHTEFALGFPSVGIMGTF